MPPMAFPGQMPLPTGIPAPGYVLLLFSCRTLILCSTFLAASNNILEMYFSRSVINFSLIHYQEQNNPFLKNNMNEYVNI